MDAKLRPLISGEELLEAMRKEIEIFERPSIQNSEELMKRYKKLLQESQKPSEDLSLVLFRNSKVVKKCGTECNGYLLEYIEERCKLSMDDKIDTYEAVKDILREIDQYRFDKRRDKYSTEEMESKAIDTAIENIQARKTAER